MCVPVASEGCARADMYDVSCAHVLVIHFLLLSEVCLRCSRAIHADGSPRPHVIPCTFRKDLAGDLDAYIYMLLIGSAECMTSCTDNCRP